MAIIEWKDCYATGISEFDTEHQNLVTKINRLYEVIRSKEGDQSLSSIIDDLVDYAEVHFAHEEQLMADHNYPELADHREKHADLRKKVSAFKEQLDQNNPQLPLQLFNFLREWLLQHIVEVDGNYSSFFKDKGIG